MTPHDLRLINNAATTLKALLKGANDEETIAEGKMTLRDLNRLIARQVDADLPAVMIKAVDDRIISRGGQRAHFKALARELVTMKAVAEGRLKL